ncbi:MAG TPA: hypothetical protein VG015_02380 [Candidatus Dormibacteraeota bacterium]|jgi:hypothetical protein|nr:hypothetical protein [Candidatus Dormibacteraeota bacterium]
MDSPATYLHWGVILISVPNLIVIVTMLVVFGLALIAPFPHRDVAPDADRPSQGDSEK